MFDIHHPPILVVPVAAQHIYDFSEKAGYHNHLFFDNKVLLSYGDGWTFPVPARKKTVLTEPPMLLVRNKGGVTSESSRARSGYAHQFINDNGSEPVCFYERSIFSEAPDEWMFINDSVNVIWLQSTTQNQYLGGEGSDMLLYQYGKLIIMKLAIVMDVAPSLDRKADITDMRDIQYRVSDQQIFNTSWNMTDRDTKQHLTQVLSERGLDCFQNATEISLLRAGYKS